MDRTLPPRLNLKTVRFRSSRRQNQLTTSASVCCVFSSRSTLIHRNLRLSSDRKTPHLNHFRSGELQASHADQRFDVEHTIGRLQAVSISVIVVASSTTRPAAGTAAPWGFAHWARPSQATDRCLSRRSLKGEAGWGRRLACRAGGWIEEGRREDPPAVGVDRYAA